MPPKWVGPLRTKSHAGTPRHPALRFADRPVHKVDASVHFVNGVDETFMLRGRSGRIGGFRMG